MKENTYWFKHDYNARRDPKLIRLRRVKGMKGIGIYWDLIEIMHEQNGEIFFDELNSIAYEMGEDETNLLSVIKEFDLFEIDTTVLPSYKITNSRVMNSLYEKNTKSRVNTENVIKRWKKYETDTIVLPPYYESDTKNIQKRREEKREEEKEKFDFFRKEYSKFGTVGGLDAEWSNFIKKNPTYSEILPKLMTALTYQIEQKKKLMGADQFVAAWKNLKTWINNNCWDEVIPNPIKDTSNNISTAQPVN